MNPSNVTEHDELLAVRLARQAGERLLALRDEALLSGKALGDAGDRVANEFLVNELKLARPLDAVLSEEAADTAERLRRDRVWIVDPLDGTREYRERRDDWAVHVALVASHRVIAAAVAMPARDEVFATSIGASTLRTSEIAQQPARVVISRSRPPSFAQRVADALGAELAQVGSAGAKAMMVVRGEALAYVHDGGMNEWDAAAPVGVALAHGLHASTLRGESIQFNRADVVLRDGLIVCRKEVAATILAAL